MNFACSWPIFVLIPDNWSQQVDITIVLYQTEHVQVYIYVDQPLR